MIYTYNLTVFDPTWFGRRTPDLIERLHAQVRAKADPRLSEATDAYLEFLDDSGNLEGYMRRLVESFNPQAAHGLMCRNTVSVGWDGRLYDCDFNQMLDIPVSEGAPTHIRSFDVASLEARAIRTDRHCFGCTAGTGLSCGGALSAETR